MCGCERFAETLANRVGSGRQQGLSKFSNKKELK
jgi:hypothetical protein